MQRLCNDIKSFQDNAILNGGACEGVLLSAGLKMWRS